MIKRLRRLSGRNVPLFVALAVVGVIGVVATLATRAATPAVHVESESGTVSAPATAVTDTTASSGSATKFGPAASGCASLPKTGGGTWTCTFSDEFSGTTLDATKWNSLAGSYWGNGCYVRDAQHLMISGGYLTLRGTKNSSSTSCSGFSNLNTNYTTAAVQSDGKFYQKYGRFEMRAKLPAGQGLWPAFWMMPEDDTYGSWPASGEIDIMEALGHQTSNYYTTLHYLNTSGSDPGNSISCPVSPNYTAAFHTYTLEWTSSNMKVYTDGTLCYTHANWQSQQGFPAPFNQTFYIILNLSIGGDWPGEPNSSTTFPADFVVDYIRAWQ